MDRTDTTSDPFWTIHFVVLISYIISQLLLNHSNLVIIFLIKLSYLCLAATQASKKGMQ